MKKCVNCNALIRDNDKYCRNCGILIPSNLNVIICNIYTVLIAIGVVGFILVFIASYIVE